MSFYTSLTGLKAAQSDLATISNNVANVNSTAFKKSRTNFGDIFAAAPMQTTTQVAGQGTRIVGIQQQFTQGTVETTDKTLDLAITGEAFFTTRTPPPTSQISYTRNGAFEVDDNRNVIDTVGGRLQVFPVDVNGVPTGTTTADLTDLQIPLTKPSDPTVQLSSVSVTVDGLVTATFADSTTTMLGSLAMAAFPSQEGLRLMGDAHGEATLLSG
ncbi:MAG: flagellar hook-basal body complex protein, partial [Sphingobium sp.]